eukprot:COSAG06_NODE_7475_length_2491_cov_3.809783_1_plen_36_part_10
MQWLKVTVAFAPHAYITAEQRSTMRPQHPHPPHPPP